MKPKNEKQIKSPAKAAGLKSILFVINKMILTYFEKGADSGIEKIAEKKNSLYEIQSIADPQHYDASIGRMNLTIKGENGIQAKPSNPSYSNKTIGRDIVRIKDYIEEKIFGQTYKDNIHIQIAYQILDIFKVLVPYINDITYSLNSKLKSMDAEKDFFEYGINYYIGSISKKQEEFNNLCEEMLNVIKQEGIYFQEAFYDIKTVTNKRGDESKKLNVKSDEKLKIYLRVLSKLRQTITHFDSDNSHYIFSGSDPKFIVDELKTLFDEKRKIVNNNFIVLNQKANFSILDKIYNINNADKSHFMHQNFYDFTILSMGKNLGFSIKLLREEILKLEGASYLSAHDFDTSRSKMYNFIDFIIYHYFVVENHELEIQSIVENLRSNLTDEGKDKIYQDLAKDIFDKIKSKVDILAGFMIPEEIKKLNKDKIKVNFTPQTIEGNFFSYIIYFVTLFLDKKEVNDLTTTIINKLENIESFNKIYQKITDKEVEYKKEYKMLLQAKETSKLIRLIQVIALKKEEMIPTNSLYLDAFKVLGYQSKKDRKEQIDFVKQELDLEGKDHNFRNFIINNVVKSKRFIYLIKHMDPEYAALMAKNKQVVSFVLKRIEKEVPLQIDKYYKGILGKETPDSNNKIEVLTNKIAELKYSDFKYVKTKHTPEENVLKEKSKAVVGLYLTVLYLIYKNLVNVNSRYAIAFWSLERDYELHRLRKTNSVGNLENYVGLLRLTNLFYNNSKKNKDGSWPEEPWLNKKQTYIIEKNLSDLGSTEQNIKILSHYRNTIEHQNLIRQAHELIKDIKVMKSYFDLYHTMMQLYLNSKYDKASDIVKKHLTWVANNKCYSRDLLWIMNLPFAYHTARYKKISIEDLFDKNDEMN